LVRTARERAKDRGRAVSATVADRLTETLDAALIDPGAAQQLRSGQLTSALRHVGFGVVDETGAPVKFAPMKPRTVRRAPAKAPAKQAVRPQRLTVDSAVERRTAELRTRAEEAEAEHTDAEAERAEAESLLDANQHQVTDLLATIERLNDELEQARQQLRAAQRQTSRLERGLDRATRTAALAQRRRDASRQRLANLND
jgi:septal ring factor EnvC (AmiA/AmiB activator)